MKIKTIFTKIKTIFFINRLHNHYLYCERLHDMLLILVNDLEDYYDSRFKFKFYYEKGKYGYIVGTLIRVPKNIEEIIKEANDKRCGFLKDLAIKDKNYQQIKLYIKI